MRYPIADIPGIVQRMGSAKYISCSDAKGAYWQTKVRSDNLTEFVCDQGVFEWEMTPFGMKYSGSTFVGAVQQVSIP